MTCVADDGSPGLFAVGGTCYATSYGAKSCAPHDLDQDPLCREDSPPAYCYNAFCYVDATQCKTAPELFYKSTRFPDQEALFYSYSTCNSTADDWLSYQTTDVFLSRPNQNLVLVIPADYEPVHYKTNESHYYDDTKPWKGWFIDYLNAIVEISNIPGIDYTHTSIGATELLANVSSSWTKAVHDVKAGIVDGGASNFWVTNERLEMAPFTVPMAPDKFFLWVEQPEVEDGTLLYNSQKLLLPFSKELWLAIVVVVMSYALLNQVLVPYQDMKAFHEQTAQQKTKTVLATTVDASIEGWLRFMERGSSDYKSLDTMSQKILSFGFGFATFIAVTAYTANLAAFLTISGEATYYRSMEQAIAAGVPICTRSAVKTEMENLYPTANFVFGGSALDLLELYQDGHCKVIVTG